MMPARLLYKTGAMQCAGVTLVFFPVPTMVRRLSMTPRLHCSFCPDQDKPGRQAHRAFRLESERPRQDGPASLSHVLSVLRGGGRAVVPNVPAQRGHGLGGAVQHRLLRASHAAGCSGAAAGRFFFFFSFGGQGALEYERVTVPRFFVTMKVACCTRSLPPVVNTAVRTLYVLS